ncbi:MAG: sirohydrochlorin cobaltochelatase [Pseudomonadota bacterium]
MTEVPGSIKPPVVIAAFGTTSHARNTYDFMDQRFQQRFPGHEIRWAFTSRMVKGHVMKHSRINDMHSPGEVLETLYAEGHSWAVVQSLHLISGHEFYRLVEEVGSLSIRTSIGLPLLTSYRDYCRTARAMNLNDRPFSREEAVVLVGHGTDHPAWTAYFALKSILRQSCRPKIFVGMIEGKPSRSRVVGAVFRSGIKKVRLIPFTLVAGVHFQEDIAGDEDSWKAAFESIGVTVEVETRGIGYRETIIDIFAHHIQEALSVIPVSGDACIRFGHYRGLGGIGRANLSS